MSSLVGSGIWEKGNLSLASRSLTLGARLRRAIGWWAWERCCGERVCAARRSRAARGAASFRCLFARRKAELMLGTTVVLWALNFTVTKYALTHGFRPLAYSAVRYGAATVLFTWFTYGKERSFAVRRRDLGLIVLAAAIGIWLNQISYVYSLKFSSASTIALILGATPIFTALIAFALGLE